MYKYAELLGVSGSHDLMYFFLPSEYSINFICLWHMIWQEQRAASRENVERRLARTADELAEEEGSDDSDLSDVGDASDDEETVPYNPKNLPLGWDGKV